MRLNLGKLIEGIIKASAVVGDLVNSMKYNHVQVPEPLEKLNTNLQRIPEIAALKPAAEKLNAFYDEAEVKDLNVKLVALDADGEIVMQLDQSDEERDATDRLLDVVFG